MGRRIRRSAQGIAAIFLICALSLPGISVSTGAQTLHPTRNPIPLQFFGQHFHRLASTTPWPDSVRVGSWRLLGAYVDWPNIEPSRGTWDFKTLDLYVGLAEQHHVRILMPLVLCPQWAASRPAEPSSYGPGNASVPKDLEDWRTYVRTVATRYKGRIHEYEIWNEPDEKFFYTGTVPQLVEMARIAYTTLKEVDPTNLVSSPPFTLLGGVKWLDQYLQAGGGKYADVIGFHFYVAPNPPEAMIDLVQQVKAVMEKNGISDKQLWNTESGWAMANHLNQVQVGNSGMGRVLTVPEAVGYVARANILLWAAGVSRFFYYSWDNKIMGLTEEDGKTIKEPASAYAEVEKWLIDAVMLSCGKSADGTWTSEITRDGGYRGWILWNPDRSLEFRVPAEWHILSVRELLGGAKKLSPDQKIQINQTPILLENTVR